jgi:prepilin-type N-terminal cleavage/methylation domain-containing protein/prepilin-type processing-associated H-X9-DG protein
MHVCSMRLRRAFTLVELLIVLAIVGLLLAMLLPATQYAREAARRTTCQNQLRQMGVALQLHHDTHLSFPSGWTGWEGRRHEISNGPGFGWAAMILPEMEQPALAEKIDYSQSILSPANELARATYLSGFRCPSDSGPKYWELRKPSQELLGRFPTANYVGNFGSTLLEYCDGLAGTGLQCDGEPYGGMLYHNSHVRIPEVVDGTSNTILVGERCSNSDDAFAQTATWVGATWEGHGSFSRVVGTARHSLGGSRRNKQAATTFSDFSSQHAGGAYFVYVDGHVDFVSEQIDHLAFVDLSTRSETFTDAEIAASEMDTTRDSETGSGGAGGPDAPSTGDESTDIPYPGRLPPRGGGCPICGGGKRIPLPPPEAPAPRPKKN